MFYFQKFQNSMIAFQNADQVKSFEFFDKKNRTRVHNIRGCILAQKDNLNTVTGIMNKVKDLVQDHEHILVDYEEMNNKRVTAKQKAAAEEAALMQARVEETAERSQLSAANRDSKQKKQASKRNIKVKADKKLKR
jgi:hypothetical protein